MTKQHTTPGGTGRQAGVSEIEITPEMTERVLGVLRDSGIADHVSEFDTPLAQRICRTVLLAQRENERKREAFR